MHDQVSLRLVNLRTKTNSIIEKILYPHTVKTCYHMVCPKIDDGNTKLSVESLPLKQTVWESLLLDLNRRIDLGLISGQSSP